MPIADIGKFGCCSGTSDWRSSYTMLEVVCSGFTPTESEAIQLITDMIACLDGVAHPSPTPHNGMPCGSTNHYLWTYSATINTLTGFDCSVFSSYVEDNAWQGYPEARINTYSSGQTFRVMGVSLDA